MDIEFFKTNFPGVRTLNFSENEFPVCEDIEVFRKQIPGGDIEVFGN